MQQHSNKKNDRQEREPLAGLRRRPGQVRTVENTSSVAVRSRQGQNTFVQGDLLNFKVLQSDLFGDSFAAVFYD